MHDEAKPYMVTLSMAFHTKDQLPISIVLIFNTDGPRMRLNDGRVIPDFLGQVFRDEPLTVFRDGIQTQSCCYIADLVEGICRALMSGYPIR